jgi:hypothetical protein
MEYLELGPTPAEEDCQQTIDPDYATKARAECAIYRAYLERLFPIPQELQGDVEFGIKGSAHDFGTYYEVRIGYNPNNDQAAEFAFNVESNLPSRWDTESLKALSEKKLIIV